MLRYAQKEFELDKHPKESKATLRAHLLSLYEQTGEIPVELENEPPNEAVAYLLGYFQQLSTARQCGMSLNPLTFTEIEAWGRLYKMKLDSWEIDVIKQLDLIYLNTQMEH